MLAIPYAKLRSSLLSGEYTCQQVVDQYLQRIEADNAKYHAFLEVYAEEAKAQAKRIDEKIKAGQAGKLAGMVIGIKDLLCYENHGSSAGSNILKGFQSTFSATAVSRLLAEDAIIIGRQNCDEFGMGSTNENSAFGPSRNYLDPERVTGGSSGGSALAVQANFCALSLGTDTGGSIRMPAAFCGIAGFKPSYGLVSRWGLIAYASSFDSIGPMGHFVEDLALVHSIIAGPDGRDATLVEHAPEPKQHRKLAYLEEVINHPSLQEEIKQAFWEQVERLKAMGYEVLPKKFSYIEQLLPTYYVLTTAEASSNLARFDGVKFGHRSAQAMDLMSLYKKSRSEAFGPEVKRRIILGTFVLSADYYDAYYTKAQKVRRLIQKETLSILDEVDAIISPTTASTAYRLGDKTQDPLQMYLGDLFTVQANVVGLPAVSIPAGKDSQGMPIGFQMMGAAFSDDALLSIAQRLQNEA